MATKILYVPVSWSHDPVLLRQLKAEEKLDAYNAALDATQQDALKELDEHMTAGWRVLSEHLIDLTSGNKVAFILHRFERGAAPVESWDVRQGVSLLGQTPPPDTLQGLIDQVAAVASSQGQ